MAHSCPDCGQACYCNGDIDDTFDVDPHAQEYCVHQCDPADSDDDDDDDATR